MSKIEDVKIKDYKDFFKKERKNRNLTFPSLNLLLFLPLFFLIILSFNVAAAPLNLPTARALDPETQKKKESLEAQLQDCLLYTSDAADE